MSSRTLRVGYPLSFLLPDQRLVRPSNTASVFQYYLLENLAIGLVRDCSRYPSGYAPGLAESWQEASPTRWVFVLRQDLRWSDGTPIDAGEIAAHIRRLRDGVHRHVTYLKLLSRASLDGRRLILDFKEPVNAGLIHELSLADAALVSTRNLKTDWAVTSGPFFVAEYEPGRRVLLRRNRFYPAEFNYPDQVELTSVELDAVGPRLKDLDVDLVKVPEPAFEPSRAELKNFPQVLRGYPTRIYHLYFDRRSPLWRDEAARLEMAAEIDAGLRGYSNRLLPRERQYIPAGFAGRLRTLPSLGKSSAKRLAGRRLRINIPPHLAGTREAVETVKAQLEERGVDVQIQVSSEAAQGDRENLHMARFVGNQRDAVGSWSFLFSQPRGALSPYRAEAASLLARVLAVPEGRKRDEALRALHLQVLKRAFGIPLFVDQDVIVAKSRLDISSINPFDMRMRFYEIRWR